MFRYDPSKLLPRVELYVHLSQHALENDTGGVCRVEGHPPLSVQWVRDHLRPEHRFTITPVLDPLRQASVDSYELPHAHREAVRLLTPADCFPFATRVGRPDRAGVQEIDIDHTTPHPATDPGAAGRSQVGNYGPMSRFHHRVKTHSTWQLKQPYPGIFLWRDPVGRIYLVDHTGTRAVPRHGAG